MNSNIKPDRSSRFISDGSDFGFPKVNEKGVKDIRKSAPGSLSTKKGTAKVSRPSGSEIKGITNLYYAFLKHLRKATVKRRVAPLQLAGKIEDYLTKEFVSFLFTKSKGARFAIVNSGSRGEPKIDMAVIKDGPMPYTAEAFLEAKYFRNRHRLSPNDMDAIDEHPLSFLELKKQVSFLPQTTHGKHGVKLRSKSTKIYGLVFVSYTRKAKDKDRKNEYYPRFLESAEQHGLSYHDLLKPYLRTIYEDFPVNVLGCKWLISLRGGLWRLKLPTPVEQLIIGQTDTQPEADLK